MNLRHAPLPASRVAAPTTPAAVDPYRLPLGAGDHVVESAPPHHGRAPGWAAGLLAAQPPGTFP